MSRPYDIFRTWRTTQERWELARQEIADDTPDEDAWEVLYSVPGIAGLLRGDPVTLGRRLMSAWHDHLDRQADLKMFGQPSVSMPPTTSAPIAKARPGELL